jgi:hypothetical protein
MMKISVLIVALFIPALVLGQGKIIQYNKDPVVDVPKGEEAKYKQDLQECAAIGGAAGGVSGLTAGAMQDSTDAGFVVWKCLDGRGWTVLDYDGQR